MRKDFKLFAFLLVFAAAMMFAGWQISKPFEYHNGIEDGKRSTMLTDYTTDPCQVTYEIRKGAK